MQIPGLHHLTSRDEIPNCVLMLTGSMGVGKSVYCRSFYLDGLTGQDYCIYIDCMLDESEFRRLFPDVEEETLIRNSLFLNPYRKEAEQNDTKLKAVLQDIKAGIESRTEFGRNLSSHVRLVLDSITHLLVLFSEKAVEDFVRDLYFLLRKSNASAIFTLAVPSVNEHVTNRLACLFDGAIEMEMEDIKGDDRGGGDMASCSFPRSSSPVARKIRILSIKNMGHRPSWVQFEISEDGRVMFGKDEIINCYLCKEPVLEDLVFFSELPFHLPHLEMYKKFNRLYGINVTDIGVSSSEAIDGNFFFIDIVGLSNPSLPVNKQREKIENLNDLIASCDAFKIVADNKIILPTGDGMVIGYLVNPELPLQLSIQLHRKLKEYNIKKSGNKQDQIGVRIGLSSGPVFKVNDIKNNPNYWGPGIILARRVMDIGNNGHILMDNNLALSLISLKDEYSRIIKPIGKYRIKHGVEIELYSVFSKDFGNPELPMLSSVIS